MHEASDADIQTLAELANVLSKHQGGEASNNTSGHRVHKNKTVDSTEYGVQIKLFNKQVGLHVRHLLGLDAYKATDGSLTQHNEYGM